MYARKSTDNGLTWLPSDTLSDVASPLPLQPDPFIVSIYVGDYDYGSSIPTKHVTSWADGRVPINNASQQDAFTDSESTGGGTPTPTPTASPTPTPACTVGWSAGANLPSVGVRLVGVYFPANGKFYAMGGRSADPAGSDFTNPFEYDPSSNSWATKAATYPDNQVNNMACGVLTDAGTPYIYCVGGSAAGQTTAADRVFRYDPVADVISPVAAPWPGNANLTTLPGGFTIFQNKLYILGGFNINVAMTNQIWEFTPGTNAWVQKAAVLPVARGYIPTTTIGTLIYTGGGSDFTTALLILQTPLFITRWGMLSARLPAYRGQQARPGRLTSITRCGSWAAAEPRRTRRTRWTFTILCRKLVNGHAVHDCPAQLPHRHGQHLPCLAGRRL